MSQGGLDMDLDEELQEEKMKALRKVDEDGGSTANPRAENLESEGV